jgi:hypothetical protein
LQQKVYQHSRQYNPIIQRGIHNLIQAEVLEGVLSGFDQIWPGLAGGDVRGTAFVPRQNQVSGRDKRGLREAQRRDESPVLIALFDVFKRDQRGESLQRTKLF